MMNQPTQLSLVDILNPINSHLEQVETLLAELLETNVPLLNEIGKYILKSGGKRVRPALLLLAAGTVGKITDEACLAACVIEYLHTASLLHDDVVDNATLRRSKKSARTIWGNEASVLVGDYLFGIAFNSIVTLKNLRIIDVLSETSTIMARGELKQLSRSHDSTDESEYLDIIYHKTASLMGSSMRIGAILGGGDQDQQKKLYECGINIGIAFQLVDDALDYDIKNQQKGKQTGIDLKERKITLPLSHVLQVSSSEEKKLIFSILNLENITDDHVEEVCQLIHKYDSISYTLRNANDYVNKSKAVLSGLDETEFLTSIRHLSEYIVLRKK